jgi:hypothetical protein
MKARIHPLYMFALLILLTRGVAGQEASKPWWNPFSTSSSADAGTVRSSSFFDGSMKNDSEKETASGKSMFSFPKMPWASEEKPKKSSSTSTLSRMGKSTKKFWNSTVDLLNPFDSEPQPKQQGYQPQNVKKSSSNGPFGWMWPEEKTETPATVNDFLRQPRPRF